MNAASGAFTLPADLVLLPVAELQPEVLRRIDCADGDVVLTRPAGRIPSRIVDAQCAEFVAAFREPTTIAAAIVAYSRQHRIDSADVLEAIFPVVMELIDARFLVPAGDASIAVGDIIFVAGDRVAGCVIDAPIALRSDTQVYSVRRPGGDLAVLKIAARAGCTTIDAAIAHEAEILGRLDGRINPRLYAAGSFAGRGYLLMEWRDGISIVAAASRASLSSEPAAALRQLAVTLLAAYAYLHAQRVVHGDVHAGNVRCAADGTITILDYALAFDRSSHAAAPTRGGAGWSFEPELVRSGGTLAPTERGEVYALAALVFELFTGTHYLDFALERETVLQQILADPPRSFAACGIASQPAVEAVIARALSKNPDARYASVAAFAAALAAAEPVARALRSKRGPSPELRRFAADVIATIDGDRAMAPDAVPTASVTFGAAGVALGCLRMAFAGDDPRLFALAESWSARALAASADAAGFGAPSLGVTPESVGPVSPYHTQSGVHAVRAFIAAAGGDWFAARAALDKFLESSSAACDSIELAFGLPGSLVAAASLVGALRPGPAHDVARVQTFGDRIATTLESRLEALSVEDRRTVEDRLCGSALGVAHGWPGPLFALFTWARISGRALRPSIARRLEVVASATAASPNTVAGWCNGSAGWVFTWLAAHAVLDDDFYLARAQQAALHVRDAPQFAGNVCCGDAGRAYALLAMYRATGDARWVSHAEALAHRAVISARANEQRRRPWDASLFKGRLGLAVLIHDLADPQRARMPFFECDDG